MNDKPTQQQFPAKVPDMDLQRVIDNPGKGVVEFVPYGTDSKIKLSVKIVQDLVAVKTKLGKSCSEREALKFLAMCLARKMNPFEGDCYLIGYDSRDGATFSMITAHQTYLKRAELHPEFDGMQSGLIVRENGILKEIEGDFFDTDQTVVGGWALVHFKNRKQPMLKRLRLERFKQPFGIWVTDPAGMICKCAEADALRSSFPTMLGGLFMKEEIQEPRDMAKPAFTSPVAGKPQLFGRTNTPAIEMPANGQEQQAEPEPETQPEPEQLDSLGLLRALVEKSKLTEAMLLDYLSSTGSTDGSVGSLDELFMVATDVVHSVIDQWPEISGKMIAQLKKVGAK